MNICISIMDFIPILNIFQVLKEAFLYFSYFKKFPISNAFFKFPATLSFPKENACTGFSFPYAISKNTFAGAIKIASLS